MRVLVVGASGTIGKAVVEELEKDPDVEVIKASRNGLDATVDITSVDSIREMFKSIGKIDALVSTTGAAYYGPLEELTPENNLMSVNSKLLGQVNLALIGLDYIKEHGSITLITGILKDEPLAGCASIAMANGGVDAFVKTAAIEMPRGIRINSVSPNVVEESLDTYGSLFVGFEPVKASQVALAFKRSIYGRQTGRSYCVYH